MNEVLITVNEDEVKPMLIHWTNYVVKRLKEGINFDLEKCLESFKKFVKRNYNETFKYVKEQAYEAYPECPNLEDEVLSSLYRLWILSIQKSFEENI